MGVIRLVLALAVVITHTGGNFLGFKIIPGYTCVELFFIISGFYMEFILSGSYNRKRDFYISRFLRLWPLFFIIAIGYYLFAAGYTLLSHNAYTIAHAKELAEQNIFLKISALFSNLTMIGQDIFSWFYIGPGGNIKWFYGQFLDGTDAAGYTWGGNIRMNGPAWSIGLEIWFYLLVPYLHKLNSLKIIILLAISIVARFLLLKSIGLHTYFFFPTQFYLFLAGMLAYRHKKYLDFRGGIKRILYLILLIGVVGYWYIPVNKELLRLFLLPLFLTITLNTLFYNFYSIKWDRVIGDLSYPVYISHSFIILVTPKLFEYLSIPFSSEKFSYLLYLIVILFSLLWTLKVEKIINKFRWRIAQKQAF